MSPVRLAALTTREQLGQWPAGRRLVFDRLLPGDTHEMT
jgi:hypothetical protein